MNIGMQYFYFLYAIYSLRADLNFWVASSDRCFILLRVAVHIIHCFQRVYMCRISVASFVATLTVITFVFFFFFSLNFVLNFCAFIAKFLIEVKTSFNSVCKFAFYTMPYKRSLREASFCNSFVRKRS